MERIIVKDKFPLFLEGVKNAYGLFGPVRKGDVVCFAPIERVEELDLKARNTVASAKGLFLPQSEKMFECGLDSEQEDGHILKGIPLDTNLQAVVGIRPCDARAMTLVDVNFDTAAYRDPWWKAARERTVLVGLGCDQPCSTCFCSSVGGGPFDETGLDVLLVDTDEVFIARAITEKGEALLGTCKGQEDPDGDILEKAKTIISRAQEKMMSPVDTSNLSTLESAALYDAPFWDDVQFSCINCGTCTYLCPTCWCFDIQDEACGPKAIRMRNWDSCMFPLFTLHASGHNPRGGKLQRVRQRFMHKLKYYVDKYDNGVACVGCGRCIQHCPVNIDIREVVRRMNELST